MPQTAPYGKWQSPITSDRIVQKSVKLGAAKLSAGAVYWLECRPSEGGRYVLVKQGADGAAVDVNLSPTSVRTRAQEYGGGAYLLDGETVYFSNDRDQRLYRLEPGGSPEPLTAEGPWRFADGVIDQARERWIGVRESHEGEGEPVNEIVAVALAGDGVEVLVSGADFYSHPRLSPDREELCWLEWNHPDMPWDATTLKVARVAENGDVAEAEIVAGGPGESIVQPRFAADGTLYFNSDREGWWNLHRYRDGKVEAVLRKDADFGYPQWVFDWSTYAFEGDERAWCAYHTVAGWKMGAIDLATGALEEIDCPYTDISSVEAEPGRVVFIASSQAQPSAVVTLDTATRDFRVLRESSVVDEAIGPYISEPEALEFPTAGGRNAYAFYYPPTNPDFSGPDGAKPPLIVVSHGGPTAQTTPRLSLSTLYWTSRGFGVVDVNYGGSSGFGRAFRERLAGQWGVVDIDDCVAAAQYLVEQGRADPKKLIIRGSSAGGYTTLAALTFRDVFSAGASYYGVSDLEALAKDTHKFEARYLDKLVGPYPERRDLYEERSPVAHADKLSAPVIFLQGDEDKVVPPSQAERMVEALEAKGVPNKYVLFAGEQHGFRKAENIKRALDEELEFYVETILD